MKWQNVLRTALTYHVAACNLKLAQLWLVLACMLVRLLYQYTVCGGMQ